MPHVTFPKPLPHFLTKEKKRKSKEEAGEDFRAAVWTRDGRKSRASGRLLTRGGMDWHVRGEVHHVIPRSLAPDRIFDVSNGLLLSKFEHELAETRCPNCPDRFFLDISGPDDRGEPQLFIWRDLHGVETKRRIA